MLGAAARSRRCRWCSRPARSTPPPRRRRDAPRPTRSPGSRCTPSGARSPARAACSSAAATSTPTATRSSRPRASGRSRSSSAARGSSTSRRVRSSTATTPRPAPGRYKLCRVTTRYGKFKIEAKVSADNGSGHITEGRLPADTYRLRRAPPLRPCVTFAGFPTWVGRGRARSPR